MAMKIYSEEMILKAINKTVIYANTNNDGISKRDLKKILELGENNE